MQSDSVKIAEGRKSEKTAVLSKQAVACERRQIAQMFSFPSQLLVLPCSVIAVLHV